MDVLLGLASPGSVFNHIHVDTYLKGRDPEQDYIEKLMPVRLAMDYYYVKHLTLAYDTAIIIRAVYVIMAQMCARKN